MPGLMRRLGGERLATEYRVFDAYADAAGALLRARSRPEFFRNGTLFVRVESSPLAHELALLRAPLIERMAKTLGGGVITDIRSRVGPIQQSDGGGDGGRGMSQRSWRRARPRERAGAAQGRQVEARLGWGLAPVLNPRPARSPGRTEQPPLGRRHHAPARGRCQAPRARVMSVTCHPQQCVHSVAASLAR